MRNRPYALAGMLMLAVWSAACGGASPADPGAPAPAGINEWRFGVDEHIALWYHGLALARVGEEPGAAVPIHRSDYDDVVTQARRRGVGGSSPFAADPTAFGDRMEAAGVADGLQFLPLYFGSWPQLAQAVDLWARAEGDPNRVAAEAGPVVAFLSSRFPNATQRRAVAGWVQALETERTEFFGGWWRETQPTSLAAEAEALWRGRQPSLIHFLRYTDAGSGRVSLTPALRGEGRVEAGRGVAVAAVGGRTGEDARVIIGRVIHELSYAIAAEATRDAVAPARIREIGEDVLVARAAVRAGALVLERLAPDLVAPYRDDYLRAAAAEPARTTLAQQFPLPAELVEALESSVTLATAGI
ncbi:MAG TPA: hypothetical protein VMN78_02695 [Longimicrobiales bacterium]|nr:hypothetical protein [Longimicrobiales bacterium]